MTTTTIPQPQLTEDFEDETPPEWSFSVVDGNVERSEVDPKWGEACAVVASEFGHQLEYSGTQLPLEDVTRLMLGVWVRNDAPPPDTFGYVDWIRAGTMPGLDVALRLLPTEITPGTDDRFQWQIGLTLGAPFALPSAWRFLEARAWRTPSGDWKVQTRLHGADLDATTVPGLGPIPQVNSLRIDYPSAPPSPGFVAGLDRLWWWCGTDADPVPGWWSNDPGWSGNRPTVVTGAAVGPAGLIGTVGYRSNVTG